MNNTGHVNNCIRFLALGFALALLSPGNAYGQAKVGATVEQPLSLSNSARSLALGGAASTLVDEYSGLHNPGALALFYLDNYLSVTAPLSVDTWPDISFKSFAVGGGWALTPMNAGEKRSPRVALAGSYTQAVLDIEIVQTTSSNPFGENPPTFFTASEVVEYFSLGLGVDYTVQAGIGATLRRGRSILEDTKSPWDNHVDFGAHVSFPLGEILWSPRAHDISRNRVFMDISLAFVSFYRTPRINESIIVDGAIIQVSPNADPSDRTNRFGASLFWGIGNTYVNHLSLRAVYDRLTNPELIFLGSLLSRQFEQDMYGLELGLSDALFVRGGRSLERDANQWGVGVNVSRLAQAIIPGSGARYRSTASSSFLQSVDLKIDVARIDRDSDLLDDVTYLNLSLSLGRF
ncbi:MAG: hypothetical protein ACE5GA_01680 [Candidatus Zixiibacteriota bacterium]